LMMPARHFSLSSPTSLPLQPSPRSLSSPSRALKTASLQFLDLLKPLKACAQDFQAVKLTCFPGAQPVQCSRSVTSTTCASNPDSVQCLAPLPHVACVLILTSFSRFMFAW
jgi:hypothetical protein